MKLRKSISGSNILDEIFFGYWKALAKRPFISARPFDIVEYRLSENVSLMSGRIFDD